MEQWLVYSLKVIISSYSLYLIYYLLMRKDTNFTLARYYLLSSLVLSFIIPFLYIPEDISYQSGIVSVFSLEEIVVIPENSAIPINFSYLVIVYIVISSILLLRFAIRLVRIFAISKNSRKRTINNISFNEVDIDIPSFSFLRFIFINPEKYNKRDLEIILAHEIIHTKRLHSLDILLVEILQIVFWYNPVLFLYKNALTSLHEFEADRHILNNGTGFEEYGMLIIKESLNENTIAFTNNFNSSTIKRRIAMMKRKDSGWLCRLKPLAGLAIAFIVILMFNFNDVTGKGNPDKENRRTTAVTNSNTDNIPASDVFIAVDVAPSCDMSELSKNVVYPEAARKEGLTCAVFVKAYIDENGKVTKTETSLKNNGKSIVVKKTNKYHEFTVAAVAAVTKTKFTPAVKDGKNIGAWVTIPIKFQLADK